MKKWIVLSALVFLWAACNKGKKECPGAAGKNYSLTGFTKVAAGETFTITVSRGSGFSVYAKGCASDLADLDLSVGNGETLNIGYTNFKPGRYQVDLAITLPTLIAVNLSGEAKGNINGFKNQPSVIRSVLSGNAACTLNGAPVVCQAELSGNSGLTVTGDTENLYGNLSGNSTLQAYSAAATEVDISASGNAKAYVLPLQHFYGDASGNGCIYYKGIPAHTFFETSGNGKIIHE